jgi:transposase-like protein
MIRRRTCTREFKEPAVELYRSHSDGKTAKEAADGPGIRHENLCRRLRESKADGESNIKVFPCRGNPLDEEERECGFAGDAGLKPAEILKKATAFFAVKNPRQRSADI